MNRKRGSKSARKDQSLLVSVAKSIGSALGTVAAESTRFSKRSSRRPVTKKAGSRPRKSRKKRNV